MPSDLIMLFARLDAEPDGIGPKRNAKPKQIRKNDIEQTTCPRHNRVNAQQNRLIMRTVINETEIAKTRAASERIMERLNNAEVLPSLCALAYCLKHAAKGGTIETFKPILRAGDYVGADRREQQRG